MRRIALIDTDGLCYTAACRSEQKCGDGAGGSIFFETRTVEKAYEELEREIERLVAAVHADDAILCLTHGENFRLAILPTYKGNRRDQRRPVQLTALRDMLQERKPYPVLIIKGLEADDVLGISSGALQRAGKEPIIVSEDKDLKTIPGLLYRKKDGCVRITRMEADTFHLIQTLTGDTVDGYSGCPGIGPEKAALLWCIPEEFRWDYVVSCYEAAGLSEREALTQARVARILRFQDWNADRESAILWEPPVTTSTSPSPNCFGKSADFPADATHDGSTTPQEPLEA